ncbi:MAG TPA: T9SS type A sorting domain-containing protein [Saprospiraceae bacterium]|nr:T9SS type A sorting domain-containing protein [Saprospiraceae bacterium]HMP23941.1 T9SS type A sorting domain-containing protein [Saprospiraceae bacterium]
MKKILLLLCLGVAMWNTALAQTCEPAQNLPDSLVGVIPFPFDATLNPTGGINDTACVNEPFEFVFTLVVPDIFELGGVSLPLRSINLSAQGAISNLPNGITYACDPPNCIFPADTSGCVVLYGTVMDTAGIYDLQIAGVVSTVFIDLPLSFPDPNIFPGNYFLHVREQGQCTPSNTRDLGSLGVSATVQPNPFNGFAQIVINTPLGGDFDFIVSDLLGRRVARQRVHLINGENTIPFDGGHLAPGVYIYTLSDGQRQLSGKMVAAR